MLAHFSAIGVRAVLLRPPAGGRLAKLVANLALADLVCEVSAR